MFKSMYVKIGVLLLIVLAVLLVPVYNEQQQKFEELRIEKEKYEKELKKAQSELDNLEKELKEIDSPKVKEKMAREKLGMVKKDEIQYSIKKDNTLEIIEGEKNSND